ncbi:protein TolR [Halochromatium glycolicum]|uniref:Tol-Pal system protein TolR n=1 Tax=Halochromatium glycolicum TaxID=85075 RepID=A0AAJ0U2K8_9GAMM|nr:protein TolR [Halochromatium glycolicum]MBK1704057.1 protein TolR [Halochromatium glycolicum]
MKRKERRNRRRPMAEINVVPYIDVMLVLLVIFMVTAPLITQGVKVDLPRAEAQPQPGDGAPPVVIHVDQFGDTYVDLGDAELLPVDQRLLYERLRAVLTNAPGTTVVIRADRSVDYGVVVEAMVAAQAAGAPSVGLVTQPLVSPSGDAVR